MAVINGGSTRRGMELGTVQIINFYFSVKLNFKWDLVIWIKKDTRSIQGFKDTGIQGYKDTVCIMTRNCQAGIIFKLFCMNLMFV